MRKLSERDVLKSIQGSLKEGFAVAHYTREQTYEYYIFDGIDDMITFLKENNDFDFSWDDMVPDVVYFLSDEWFLFASDLHAIYAYAKIKEIFPDDSSD